MDVINVTAVFVIAFLPTGYCCITPNIISIVRARLSPCRIYASLALRLHRDQAYLSFPSGHASFAVLIAASLWPILSENKRFIALLFVAGVFLSRIALGAHYPTDVLAGGLSCLFIVLVSRDIFQKLTGHYAYTR